MNKRIDQMILAAGCLLCAAVVIVAASERQQQHAGVAQQDSRRLAAIVAVGERRDIDAKGIDHGDGDAVTDLRAIDRLCGERVTALPEDGATWHTTVFTTAEWQQHASENAVVGAFYTDPQLTRLRLGTNFNHYTPENRLWNSYRAVNDRLPSVVVQDPEGAVVFKASGPAMAADGKTPLRNLAKKIVAAVRRWCPNCPRPDPDDKPAPEEKPADPLATPAFVPFPDVLPPEPPEPQQAGIIVPLGLAALVGVIAVVNQVSRRVNA